MENLFQGTESAKTEATIRVFAGSALKRHSQLNRPDASPSSGLFRHPGFYSKHPCVSVRNGTVPRHPLCAYSARTQDSGLPAQVSGDRPCLHLG
jgi:hypothetical protein